MAILGLTSLCVAHNHMLRRKNEMATNPGEFLDAVTLANPNKVLKMPRLLAKGSKAYSAF